jgi:hypothetical protein
MMRSLSLFTALMLTVAPAFAYQVTGPVVDVTPDKIVVEKNKEKWEIARDKDTKVTGDPKKGSKVTVQYRMTATSIDAKTPKTARRALRNRPARPQEEGHAPSFFIVGPARKRC